MRHHSEFFYWAPRLLSIGYVLFLSLFALDVFSQYSGLEVFLALFIHLIPSILLFVVTAIAWKHELVGAIVFVGFAAFYIWDVGFERPISWYLTIALPAAIVGILYFLSWLRLKNYKRKPIQ